MIVIDIETSGTNQEDNGIWQIGAVEIENPENIFLDESRIDDKDKVHPEALLVTGKTEEELRDKRKQTQKELLMNLFRWIENIDNTTLIAQNTPFDYGFITQKVRKYGLKIPFGHRTFDLPTIASLKYKQIKGKFFMENGKSAMNLPKIIEFCGMKDKRIILKDGKVIQNGNAHNALEDAKLEAECFSRLVYGKNLIKDYGEFEVPKYLKE